MSTCVAFVIAQGSGDLDGFYRARRWFELRAAVTSKSPTLLRGAVDAAFNDPAQQRLLREIIRSDAPPRCPGRCVRMALAALFAGRPIRAIRPQLRRLGRGMSIVDGASGQKDGVDEFRGRPDQDNERRRAAVLRHDTDSFSLPLSINGRSGEFLFDSGASTTDLNATFADAFRDVVDRSGGKGTASITGAGGTRTFESAELPELAFAIDLSRVSLRPASVTLQRIRIIGGDCCVGNVGHDLLAQTQAFSIDFSTMTLRLE